MGATAQNSHESIQHFSLMNALLAVINTSSHDATDAVLARYFLGMNNALYPLQFVLMAEVGSDPLVCTGMVAANMAVAGDDGCVHDPYRIDYLSRHIATMRRAMEYGVQMLAYCPWSALDLLSTSNGMKKRYGLVYVDRTDSDPRECRRYRKDSFEWYKGVIATRGAGLAL